MQPKDRHQALIDPPHLLRARQAEVVSEAVDIDGPDLFNQYLRGFAFDHNLRSEAGRPSATGRRSDQYARVGKECVSLHHDAEASSLLLMAGSPRWT